MNSQIPLNKSHTKNKPNAKSVINCMLKKNKKKRITLCQRLINIQNMTYESYIKINYAKSLINLAQKILKTWIKLLQRNSD